MRLFLAALLPALAFGKIIKLCFKRSTTFKCCSDHFLEQSFANVDTPQLLCPTPSCSCPSGNCSHAHSWSGSGCCQAQAGAPLFAPAHSLLLNFCQMPGRGTFHFSQVANQARAAASLQQGLIMAEVEFSSPLRRDNAQ